MVCGFHTTTDWYIYGGLAQIYCCYTTNLKKPNKQGHENHTRNHTTVQPNISQKPNEKPHAKKPRTTKIKRTNKNT